MSVLYSTQRVYHSYLFTQKMCLVISVAFLQIGQYVPTVFCA